jgi:hypothetical protein
MISVLLPLLLLPPGGEPPAKKPAAGDLAIDRLAREVRAWPRDNACFSCHNNGDGARALYAAHRLGFRLPADALTRTTDWLQKPEVWHKNGGEGPFNDLVLARVQFAAALAEAKRAGLAKNAEAFRRAGDLLVADQSKQGHWAIDDGGNAGAPATYGPFLATVMARQGLAELDADRFGKPIARADEWLLNAKINTILEAAAFLYIAPDLRGEKRQEQKDRALALIRKGQAKLGGWGPFVIAPPEAFDTALVLLALARHRDEAGVPEMIARGRAYLLTLQKADGFWEETTRPAGSESYAERMSTTAWATLAILETAERRP